MTWPGPSRRWTTTAGARTGVYHWPTTEVRTVDWIARHTVHESVHHFSDIERLLEETET